MSEIDFGALGVEAAAMVQADVAGTATPPVAATSDPAPAAVSSTPPPSASTTPEAPAIPGQAPERTIEVDLGNGRVERLTNAQLVEAYQNGLRQADYTRKTQEVAQQRQQAELVYNQLQSQQQQLQQIANNPQAILELVQRQSQMQAQQQGQQLDPEAPVTVGQLQQVMQSIQSAQHGLQQQAQEYVENRFQVAQYAETVNQTLNSLYKDMPILKTRPEFEDMIRYNVVKNYNPQTPEDAVAAIKAVGKEFADTLEGHFKSRQQEAATQRAQLAQTGIETSKGIPPQPQAPSYFKGSDSRNLDWGKLQQAAAGLFN